MIVWVYDRWGNQINCIGDFIEFIHDDEIGTLDYIEFTIIGNPLEKGDNLVWIDDFAKWHEHRVTSIDVRHYGGSVYSHIYAENSIIDLATTYINERNAYDCSNVVALRTMFDDIDTLWETGNLYKVGGDEDLKFYHCTGYEALVNIISTWGGEIDTTIDVNKDGVYRRRLNYYAERGSDNGLLFTYGFDADDIVRTVEMDEVVTLLHCFGKGEETLDDEGQGTGNYSRRITFADINDGKDYVEDNEAKEKWGMPSSKGGKRHSEGWFIWEDEESPENLLKLGKEKLKEVSEPRISYSANVVILANAGMDFKNAQSGDRVYIRDEPLDERLNGRVTHIRRYLDSSKPTEITLGNIVRTLGTFLRDQQSVLDSLNRRSSSWDAASRADGAWLDKMIDNLNEAMNATGGYVYWEQGDGITVYDRPKDQNPTMCIQLKGAGFRIANSKKSNGEWDFRTFGTGDGFTADELIAGTIRGGSNYWNLNSGDLMFDQGSIRDAWDNHWNMTTGNVTFVHGKISDNAGNNWDMTNGTFNFQKGTINSSLLIGGIIRDAANLNYWNLTSGEFKTTNMNATNMTAVNMNATGSFSCGTDPTLSISNGVISGTNGNSAAGRIDFAGAFVETNTGQRAVGARIIGNGLIMISSPRIAVSTSTSTSNTGSVEASTVTYNAEYINGVTSDSNGSIKVTTDTVHLQFRNGFLIGYA